MGKTWNYAELSKAACEAGGPEKYVDMLVQTSKDAGKSEMMPLLGAAIVGSSLITAVTIKAIEYLKTKNRKNTAELEMARDEIIKGINDYDAKHPAEDGKKEEGEK